MTPISRLFTSTALATLIAVPATAEISANDVWNGFTTFYNAFGLKVDATKTQSGNRLTISNLKLSATLPFELGSFILTTTGLDLVENTDGTVDIIAPESLPLAIAVTLPDDVFVTTTVDYRITDYQAQAAGDPDNFTVTYQLGRADMELGGLSITGPKAKDLDFDGNFTLAARDMSGKTIFTTGDLLVVTQDSRMGALVANGSFTGKNARKGDMETTMSMTVSNMQRSSVITVPATGIDLMNLPTQLRDGMSFQYASTVRQQVTSQRVTVNGNLVSDQSTTVGNASSAVGLSKDGARLETQADDYDIDYTMPELPFPIRISASRIIGNFAGPLLKSDEEQKFTYMFDLNNLTIADDLWNQFDPDAVLPHEPGRFLLDLSGSIRLFEDLLDFNAMRDAIENGNKVAELTSLTLNGMDIKAAGAQLTGTGAFTFDNSDMTTFQGLPAPSGTASFQMSGLNALMDNLIKMGLLENDAAFGMRMGLGLFTMAGDGDDTLISDIEVKPDGQILANGKRIK
ncbi:hypothetical protein [Profundibacter sp.]|uniref:hypothetical protein n=1 Tax=Profundibacter sp. TaxID=3101071 RepID=UPI003D0DD937